MGQIRTELYFNIFIYIFKNSVRMHRICLISLAKVNKHFLILKFTHALTHLSYSMHVAEAQFYLQFLKIKIS